ncbi:hypothetical protein [Spirosoma aerophilum]
MQPKNKSLNRRKDDAPFKADVLEMIANGQSGLYVAGFLLTVSK